MGIEALNHIPESARNFKAKETKPTERRVPVVGRDKAPAKKSELIPDVLKEFSPKQQAEIMAQAKEDTIKAMQQHAKIEADNANVMASQRKSIGDTSEEARNEQRSIAMRDAFNRRLNELASFYKLPEERRNEIIENAIIEVDAIIATQEKDPKIKISQEQRKDMIDQQISRQLVKGSVEASEDDIDNALGSLG